MRLTNVIIWNYRSFWSELDDIPAAEINLSPGVNYLVGPNNVGKSNLVRAIALALDPHAHYEQELDRPQAKTWGPAIELEFTAGPEPSAAVKKLLTEVEAYERKIDGFQEPSLASEGKLRYFVEYHNSGWRDERFLTRGSYEKGQVKGRNNPRQKAVERFHEVVRFVDIKSGEDLQSLLQRGFKEILGSAMGAELVKEMRHAREVRAQYVDALGQVLRPVAKHVQDRIRRYVRGISEVDLVANVPPVEDAIAAAQIYVEDAVRTALEHKGTGVRGAMLLLLLSFIADSAKSAIVFGIEEPEAFLHPDAHRELGAGLEQFTQRNDVTLLVTSHSPFIFRSDEGAGRNAVFVVRKDESGRSSVARGMPEAARTDLLGSRVLSSLLQKADEVPSKAKLVLVVEGWTDKRYLEIAATQFGIDLAEIHIVIPAEEDRSKEDQAARGGAISAAVQAVTLRGMYHGERLIAALFDGDEDGRAGQKLLRDKFRWNNKTEVLSYEQWIAPDNVAVEAEDLFGKDVIEAFLKVPGNEGFLDEKKLRPTTKLWHYGLTKDGKPAFVAWLEKQTDAAMFEKWREPIEYLRKLITDAEAKATKKAAYQATQATATPKASPGTPAAKP